MAQVTVGIDIGGTNTAIGFVDHDGRCLADTSIPTRGSEPASALVARVADTIGTLRASVAGDVTIAGIGIGAPNANYYRGTVEYPPNIGWPGITPLVDLFRARFDVPTHITNDANAAALGEWMFGAARGMRDVVVITLGTGVGSGIIANGGLIYGADGFAGELGHITVIPGGRRCGCGRQGCLEAYASAGGLCRTVFELLAASREDSELRDVTFRNLTSALVAEAAARGDVIAKQAFERTGDILGQALATAVIHLSPEAFVLFGGLAYAGELIFGPTKRSMETNLMKIFQDKVKILPSSLAGGNVAVLGAAALSWAELDRLGAATRPAV